MCPEKVPPVSIVKCHCPSAVVPRGDLLRAAIALKNNTRRTQTFSVWFDVTSVDREPLTPYPFFKPVELCLEAERTFEQDVHILVPYSATPNPYLLRLSVGPTPGTKWDERFFGVSVEFQRQRQKNRCNLCGEESKEDAILWQDATIRLARCPSCGLVFDFDMEDGQSLLYQLSQVCSEGLTFEKNSPSIIEDYDRKNEWVLAYEIERINRESSPPAGKRLLDFGCGTGGLLAEARRAGFEVYGVETNEAAIAFAGRTKDLCVCSSLQELRSARGDALLDVIVARHTLEHVPNPMQTLREFRKLLEPGGLLVIMVPHFNFVTRRILPNSMPRFSYGLIHQGHQYYFTKKTLVRYLKGAGFSEIDFRYSILGGFLRGWSVC